MGAGVVFRCCETNLITEKMTTPTATARISSKKQTLEDAYSPPANFLEIDISDPQTHGVAKKRYTDYEVRMKTNLPVFKLKESSNRRRYSDFEWLRNELERDSKIVVPPLPGKALKLQLPFRVMMAFLKRISLRKDGKDLNSL